MPEAAQVFDRAPAFDGDRRRIAKDYLADEKAQLEQLLDAADLGDARREEAVSIAASLVTKVRAHQDDQGAMEAFMQKYDLSSEEGVLLMCLAEALLRIPDADTAEKLIRDKLSDADWEKHLGTSESLFVNASTWGLMLTGKLVRLSEDRKRNFRAAVSRLVGRSGEPVIRVALNQAMRIMGHQYVMGRDIKEATERARKGENARYRYSFDMLGEAALTQKDADRYWQAYADALEYMGAHDTTGDIAAAPSISVKLSALHPRYEYAQRSRVQDELTPKLLALAKRAADHNIALTVDAEEADRLRLQLDVFAGVLGDPSLGEWDGLGLAVQAYQKRAPAVLDWLAELAARQGRRIPVRLVKGAYWDTEIKRCQEQGLSGYPVYTRKANTDVSYLACARRLLASPTAFYPQFATHNAHTVASVAVMAGEGADYEYQRLHGMGDDLYAEVLNDQRLANACRVYAPVGSHEDLLPYLVRRLLENGANTSFVNRIVDESQPVAAIVADPWTEAKQSEIARHPRIPLPVDLYGGGRQNSRGINLASEHELQPLVDALAEHPPGNWAAHPLTAGGAIGGEPRPVTNPADHSEVVGEWRPATATDVARAAEIAVQSAPGWDATPVAERAACLRRAADLLEARMPEFISLGVHEAGKTLPDCVSEVREAVDFCRYYATRAEEDFAEPTVLPGPTGERNQIALHGRGAFACISPWNFPLAIYLGQVTAALAAGNAVLAKPAEQTNVIAFRATRLLHEAGVPTDVLQFLPGDGADVGQALSDSESLAGIAFTGSTETAQRINRTLAGRSGPIARLIAETGGQNALIADSSALPEQLVKDVLISAAGSAGQRCSALRALFVQRDVADRVIDMLAGAMSELRVGDPGLLRTDVGPVIDADALRTLEAHAERMDKEAKRIAETPMTGAHPKGTFFAPRAYEIESLDVLEREVFGPVLHVIRYRARDLDQVIDAINRTGYGLTLGIHSRIEDVVDHIAARARVGNLYVNRSIIGAVVGVQPFGGEGLSGTGPKAGGPHYLHGFATERTLTVNTSAVGGNASLLALDDG